MTRIIGGTAGGRRIDVPRGTSTRPSSDRVREALFSAIESWCGSLQGLRFLDLYAGSGAVGLEAWSRGAGIVTLVEQDRRTASMISANARTLGFPRAQVLVGTVAATLTRPPAAPYDIVFLDPPYAVVDDDLREILLTLLAGGWLAAEALVTVERSTRGGEFRWPDGFEALRSRRYGEGTFWYGRAASTCEDAR